MPARTRNTFRSVLRSRRATPRILGSFVTAGLAAATLLAVVGGMVVAPVGVDPARADTGTGTGTALTQLATLPVKGKAPLTGYARTAEFGTAWIDVDHNGCDTRDDILARDLTGITRSGSCQVTSGTLVSPYTGGTVAFTRGVTTSTLVQIDHVVALADAWQTGAQQLTQTQRITLANDPLELFAVDGTSNDRKGDGDAATWLPANTSFRCTYVAHQIAVKATYSLWVTQPEHDAMARVLASCPTQAAASATTSTPEPTAAPSTGSTGNVAGTVAGTATVASVKGRPADEARQQVLAAALALRLVTPKGVHVHNLHNWKVVKQTPKSLEDARAGSTVTLTVVHRSASSLRAEHRATARAAAKAAVKAAADKAAADAAAAAQAKAAADAAAAAAAAQAQVQAAAAAQAQAAAQAAATARANAAAAAAARAKAAVPAAPVAAPPAASEVTGIDPGGYCDQPGVVGTSSTGTSYRCGGHGPDANGKLHWNTM